MDSFPLKKVVSFIREWLTFNIFQPFLVHRRTSNALTIKRILSNFRILFPRFSHLPFERSDYVKRSTIFPELLFASCLCWHFPAGFRVFDGTNSLSHRHQWVHLAFHGRSFGNRSFNGNSHPADGAGLCTIRHKLSKQFEWVLCHDDGLLRHTLWARKYVEQSNFIRW